MADKITSFEDYKKKELHKEVAEEIAAEISPEKGPSADTGKVSQATMDIKIEDPYNFFNEEEREEYFRQRQKDLMKEKQREEAPRLSRDDEPPIRQHHKAEEEEERREKRRPEPEEYDDYEEEYEDEYDEEEGGITMELVVRIASVLTGIVILALIAMFAKVKIYDRYFAPDPDNAVTKEVVKALPEGYIEKNDTVVVSGASSLNLRTVPDSSDDATVVDAAAEGTELKRIAVSSDGSWALVEHNGQNLYAYMKYLVEK